MARQGELAEKIARRGDTSGIAVLGMAFKADTDDVRESPAVAITGSLRDKGFAIRAYDPHAMANAAPLLEGVEWCETPYDAASNAGAVVVLTEWPDFAQLDLSGLRSWMQGNLLFDYRNILKRWDAEACDMHSFSIGARPTRAETVALAEIGHRHPTQPNPCRSRPTGARTNNRRSESLPRTLGRHCGNPSVPEGTTSAGSCLGQTEFMDG